MLTEAPSCTIGMVLACTSYFALSVSAGCLPSRAADQQHASPAPNPTIRRYAEGEKLSYLMKGMNEDWRYEIQGNAVVKKDSAGVYFEKYEWSHMVSNQGHTLPPAAELHQELSLDPRHKLVLPNFAQVPPLLIGPMTDMITFYGDALLAQNLSHAGDHKYVKWGGPNSWADGNYVLLGEDSIDFDVTLTSIDRHEKAFTVVVHHVPPQQPVIQLPAAWMRTPVGDTANNWVEVKKMNGKYIASVGKETFDVEMTLSLEDGKILSGKLNNTVDQVYRTCSDEKLESCGPSAPHKIIRDIEIELQ